MRDINPVKHMQQGIRNIYLHPSFGHYKQCKS